MALATIAQVRQLGGLPEEAKLADAKITPHLDAAARELRRWIGDYTALTGDDKEDCVDAECSLAMAYLIPVLNMLCPEAIPTFQKEYGDLGLNFYDANDQEKIADVWMSRAKRAVSNLKNEMPAAGVPAMGWNVI